MNVTAIHVVVMAYVLIFTMVSVVNVMEILLVQIVISVYQV